MREFKANIIHEFKKDELVTNMQLFTKRKWYLPFAKIGILYITTNKGLYEMRIK